MGQFQTKQAIEIPSGVEKDPHLRVLYDLNARLNYQNSAINFMTNLELSNFLLVLVIVLMLYTRRA